MNSETLMPSLLAYNFAMLWNGNNVAYESSPATSQMEEEVGMEFAKLMSYKDGDLMLRAYQSPSKFAKEPSATMCPQPSL